MKKLFAFALAAGLLLIGTQANAQIMPGAGFISSTTSGQYNGNKEDNINFYGLYAGASYNVALPVDGLAVAPGAYLSVLSNFNDSGIRVGNLVQTSKTTTNEVALNIPVLANYSYSFSSDSKAFVYLGPTFQLGLSSKSHLDASGIVDTTQDTDFYAENFYKRFNLFVSVGVGAVIMDHLVFTAGFNKGLLNIYAGDTADTYYRQANFILGVNYMF